MASIDKIDWHSGGDFPKNLPAENGGTHIGMYLTWIIDNDLIGQMHIDDSADAIRKVKDRQITGRDFLIQICDEKFWDDDLNEIGLRFTNHYYQSNGDGYGLFLDDYCETLGQNTSSLYEIENTWDNYYKLKPVIDKRYTDWRKSFN